MGSRAGEEVGSRAGQEEGSLERGDVGDRGMSVWEQMLERVMRRWVRDVMERMFSLYYWNFGDDFTRVTA